MKPILQLALTGALAIGATLLTIDAARAVGACECNACELASGLTTYNYQYDEENDDPMKAGLAAQRRVTRLAKTEAGDVGKKGPLCEAPCAPEGVTYSVDPPSFMSTPTGGGQGEARARWHITGSCKKKREGGIHLGIGFGIGVGGGGHHEEEGGGAHQNNIPVTQPPNNGH